MYIPADELKQGLNQVSCGREGLSRQSSDLILPLPEKILGKPCVVWGTPKAGSFAPQKYCSEPVDANSILLWTASQLQGTGNFKGSESLPVHLNTDCNIGVFACERFSDKLEAQSMEQSLVVKLKER